MAIARSQKEIRQRAPLLMVGLLIVSAVMMGFSARSDTGSQNILRSGLQAVLSPFQRVSTGVASRGSGFFERIGNLRHAAAENDALKERVNQLESDLQQARAENAQIEDARSLAQLQKDLPYTIIPARVIARDPSGWFDSVILNQGSLAGIQVSMPVVTADGVVGRVVATSPITAQVMLLTDQRAAAGAIVGQLGVSHATGSVRGAGESGMLEMRYVPGTETIQLGDQVLTTGQDDIYPAGLKIGTVAFVKGDISASEAHTIRLKPSARLDALQSVAVLKYQPPARPPMTESLPNVERKK
jgi:rod shape-determining protein MreC